MKPVVLTRTKAEFDAKRQQLEALARDWADRECTSFDEAVLKAGGHPKGTGSIWQMPAVDSKRVVSLLVELEPLLGCKLPPSLIKRGGYATPEELMADLLATIRERCGDDHPTTTIGVSVRAGVQRYSSV
jgi:hypothetical protein